MKKLLNISKTIGVTVLFLLVVSVLNAQPRVRHVGGYRPVYTPAPRGYYAPVRGYHYTRIGGPSVTLSFGGMPYYYSYGYYYRPYGGYYRVVAPPIGIHVGVLPPGYWAFSFGAFPYFYFNGVFYRQYNGGYEVVDAPVGAEVPHLPRGARVVVINDLKYYELDGTYYREVIKDNGLVRYQIAGKNGRLETYDSAAIQQQDLPQEQAVAPAPQTAVPPAAPAQATPAAPLPKVGDVVEALPDGTKTVVLNNQKYFVSPANQYYQELIKDNKIMYKVVAEY
ncbi:DUF6515 family protein [Filimonas effusa]|uniref:Uncharacterized protein n=1 Tax=Filimonas effusa TaxID=2508721 RepID=A0A4Q1DCJ0_9BACT|nr:DUF6515 family protein [Filimonas effusa]RXK87162.1 hypothetical protein ESB13_10390 [Filimonas effusa]